MDEHHTSGPPSTPPPPGRGPARQGRPPLPVVVHVEAKPSGFWRGAMIVISLLLFAFVFFLGLTFGIFSTIAAKSMQTVVLEQSWREGRGDTIAIIPIEGIINDQQARFVHNAADHVLKSKNIRAVVLRVDSPGGGVTASDQIWYEVQRLRQEGLPVIASFGSLAASGGYYVSCASDAIVAEETCTTGSIGVIAQVLTIEGLMDKVGIEPVTLVASGSPQKDVANNIFRTWNEQDQQKVLMMLDHAYEIFRDRVAVGRKRAISDPAAIAEIADGSIFTAARALELGLVDKLGYLDDAIAQAESLAGMRAGRARVIRITTPPSLFGGLLAHKGAAARPSSGWFDADAIRGMVNDLSSPRVLYLMH